MDALVLAGGARMGLQVGKLLWQGAGAGCGRMAAGALQGVQQASQFFAQGAAPAATDGPG